MDLVFDNGGYVEVANLVYSCLFASIRIYSHLFARFVTFFVSQPSSDRRSSPLYHSHVRKSPIGRSPIIAIEVTAFREAVSSSRGRMCYNLLLNSDDQQTVVTHLIMLYYD